MGTCAKSLTRIDAYHHGAGIVLGHLALGIVDHYAVVDVDRLKALLFPHSVPVLVLHLINIIYNAYSVKRKGSYAIVEQLAVEELFLHITVNTTLGVFKGFKTRFAGHVHEQVAGNLHHVVHASNLEMGCQILHIYTPID